MIAGTAWFLGIWSFIARASELSRTKRFKTHHCLTLTLKITGDRRQFDSATDGRTERRCRAVTRRSSTIWIVSGLCLCC
ncbi:hypothetical protein V8F06_013667 [Rhypophila decipiens]